jgi:hypothetical protein
MPAAVAALGRATVETTPAATTAVVGPATAAPAKASAIVYNALLQPQYMRRENHPGRPVLRVEQPTEFRFGIGQRWTTSNLPVIPADPGIVDHYDDVPLMAVLACSFCEAHSAYMRELVYRRRVRQSDEVSFRLVPRKREDVKDEIYEGRLELSLFNYNSGQHYGKLAIDVFIHSGNGLGRPVNADVIDFAHAPASTASEPRVDLVIFAGEDVEKRVALRIVPLEWQLRAALEPLVFDGEGKPLKFMTRVVDQEDLQQYTASGFRRLSQISMQGRLAKVLNGGGVRKVISPEAQKTLKLSEEEAAVVAGEIGRIGQHLYRLLFVDVPNDELGDALGEAIRTIEAAAADRQGPPLRIKIITDKLSLPWQYLHPIGAEVDVNKFWGMRFSLSVHRVNNRAPAAPVSEDEQSRKVVFARHGTETDPTVGLAMQQIDQLRKLPVKDLLVVKSSTELTANALTTERTKVSGIFAFLHASSGKILQATDNNIVTLEGAGPILFFADGDVVEADTFAGLRNKLDAQNLRSGARYLSAAPLVVLNACETGPSTVAIAHLSLENAMFELGARGVVVTEVSVWVALGHEVSQELIRKLGSGKTASDALTEIRVELYKSKRNPMGLLYAYYGDPMATLKR